MARGLRGWATTVLVVGLAAYFSAHALTGEQGVMAWLGYQRSITELTRDLETARAMRADLESRAERLRVDSLDLDYLDERARALAGVAHPRDVIIPFEGLPAELRFAAVDARRGRP
ncbi:MAG: septum formation initiator family protein [Caulobacterales bacterium]|nr:septum formation initiator family protein [Caulobacterales bacterium]